MSGLPQKTQHEFGRSILKKELSVLDSDGDITVVDMDKEGAIDANKLHSKNRPTPWHGWRIKGLPVFTIVRGHIQMRDGEPIGKPIGRFIRPDPK